MRRLNGVLSGRCGTPWDFNSYAQLHHARTARAHTSPLQQGNLRLKLYTHPWTFLTSLPQHKIHSTFTHYHSLHPLQQCATFNLTYTHIHRHSKLPCRNIECCRPSLFISFSQSATTMRTFNLTYTISPAVSRLEILPSRKFEMQQEGDTTE